MKNHKLIRIKELELQLLHLGYYQFQINGLMNEYGFVRDLNQLSLEELTQLIGVLEKHLDFGRRCCNVQ